MIRHRHTTATATTDTDTDGGGGGDSADGGVISGDGATTVDSAAGGLSQ